MVFGKRKADEQLRQLSIFDCELIPPFLSAYDLHTSQQRSTELSPTVVILATYSSTSITSGNEANISSFPAGYLSLLRFIKLELFNCKPDFPFSFRLLTLLRILSEANIPNQGQFFLHLLR